MRAFFAAFRPAGKSDAGPALERRLLAPLVGAGLAPTTAAAPTTLASCLPAGLRGSAPAVARPGQQTAQQGMQQATDQAAQDSTPQAPDTELFAGVRFQTAVIETHAQLAHLQFHAIINAEVDLGQHFYSRVAIAQLAPGSRECLLFVDRQRVSVDDLSAVVESVLHAHAFRLADSGPQGCWTQPQLVTALSQGHLAAGPLATQRSIARDPLKNALLASFTDIVCWSYVHGADDIDFCVLQDQPRSQVAFKIGGKYVRPAVFELPTDTVIQMLGIAWQRSSGGASAQFEIRSEQQAKIELELPRSAAIPNAARVRLRWSGMANDKGTVVTLRLQRLGDAARIRSLESAGYPASQLEILRRVIRSEGGMVVFSGVVGSGKSTSLAQLLTMLPPDLKMISIEDPVELEIPRMHQKTVTRDLGSDQVDPAFLAATRAIFRSALDVLLLGEIRDTTTGLLARQIVESGHSVYTTTHAKGALGVIDRFASPAIGMPREVLATPDILKLLVYQALLPTNCPHCAKSPTDHAAACDLGGAELVQHQRYFALIHDLYGLEPGRLRLRDVRGCPRCRGPLPELWGLAGRTVVSEMIEPDEQMLQYILAGNNV
ncbi:MAG: Toxin coregulated pilus biosynthesis protein, partial [Ramlibacter sp.]|nr:Toxin coregulated pilus biosynthesis protein [Ramlibacter sp.]